MTAMQCLPSMSNKNVYPLPYHHEIKSVNYFYLIWVSGKQVSPVPNSGHAEPLRAYFEELSHRLFGSAFNALQKLQRVVSVTVDDVHTLRKVNIYVRLSFFEIVEPIPCF